MPSRIFRVQVINKTDWPMTLVTKDAHLHGAFTEGGWEPPARIEPHRTQAFQAESDGFMQGTNGHVTYYLQENKEQVEVSWTNPWWGTPGVNGHLEVSSGSFDDWHVVGMESRHYKLERFGPFPLGQYPGLMNTDGWAELIPGLVALPLPIGTIDHAWGGMVVSKQEHPVGSLGQPITVLPPLAFAPSEGAPREAWHGTWVYPSGEASAAELRVHVGETEQAIHLPIIRLRGPSYRVSVVEHSKAPWAGRLSIEKDRVDETLTSAQRYSQDTWPPRVPIVALDSGAISEAAQLAPASAPGTLSRVPDVVSGEASRRTPAEAGSGPSMLATPGQRYATVADHLRAQVAKLQLLDAADSLVLDANVTLLLYSVHVQGGGQPLGYGVRYVRRSHDGSVLVDVMLMPAYQPPR